MKKIAWLMALMLLACAMVAPVSALTANGSYGEVPLYKGGITVDGQLDEAYTKLGLLLPVTEDFNADLKTDTTADLYMLHDGAYLYLALFVKSANPLGDYPVVEGTKNSNAFKSTGAELMIDWSNDSKETNGADTHKVVAWFNGQYWGQKLAAPDDTGKVSDYVAEYKASADKEAKTFILEYKLKMQENAAAGNEIGFNIMITSNANMAVPEQTQVVCLNPGVSNDSTKFKNVTLSLKEVKLPAAEETTAQETTAQDTTAETKAEEGTADSAETFDPAVILAAVAAAAGAGIVVSRKRR